MPQVRFRARPPRMPSLSGPISSPMVSAERILLDSKGFAWGPKSPDTCLEGESQSVQLYPEAPEQSPESQGTCLHWQGLSSPSACHSSVVPARQGCPKKGLCGFLQWINFTYPPRNNGERLTKERSGNEGIAGRIVNFNYLSSLRWGFWILQWWVMGQNICMSEYTSTKRWNRHRIFFGFYRGFSTTWWREFPEPSSIPEGSNP